MCFLLFSAWLKSDSIHEYVENKNKFRTKNNSKKFEEAIKQADEAVENEQQPVNVSISCEAGAKLKPDKLTLKAMAVNDLLSTFEDHKAELRRLFDERRGKLDRFNYGNGYSFLTVLSRIATSEQQQKMYCHMTDEFAGKHYIEKLNYENLFWTILLPEWLIAICAQKFCKSKDQIISQIKTDEEHSFNANNSSDL